MDEWLETLGGDSVRRLSGQLLIDLLRNESVPGRMADTARDMSAFVEELILAGAYSECLPVIDELLAATTRKPAIAPDACRKAVDGIGASSALGETASSLADQTSDEFAAFEKMVRSIGPAAIPAVLTAYQREDGAATDRATAILSSFGATAIPALAGALDDKRWFVQREIAKVLGKIGTAAAVPPLQSLLRRTEVRVLQTAVAALSGINDASAERALHTVLKAATGEARSAVISSLVALKDARVVPMLARVLQDSDPFGDEGTLVFDTLTALSTMRDDRAVSQIAALATKKRWMAWGRTTQLRTAALQSLKKIGTPKAKQAIADLAKTGDFFLRRMAGKFA
jgi:HEAT repeat protein